MSSTFSLLVLLGAAGALAQNSFASPSLRSPAVSPDRKVTLRLSAPTAKEVAVRGITRQIIPMQKDSSGIWPATTEPLESGLFAYTFILDRLSIADPANARLRPSYHRSNLSAVLVPGDNAWTPLPNIARGAVAHHLYHSDWANDERDFVVYTPPNYDPKRARPYLLHGLGDDEANAWTEVGSAKMIPDNLINQRQAGETAPNRLVLEERALSATFPALGAKANAQIRLLWIACGAGT